MCVCHSTWITLVHGVVGRRGSLEKVHEIVRLQVVRLELAAPLLERRLRLAGGHIGVLQLVLQTDHDGAAAAGASSMAAHGERLGEQRRVVVMRCLLVSVSQVDGID